MDRRLIDLEMKRFESYLDGRRRTLDMGKAERVRYWLDGWKQSYAAAFDTDNYRGPDLRPGQCLERIRDMEAFIADRHAHEDHGHATQHQFWLDAFVATYRLAGGKGLPDEDNAQVEEQAEEPEQAEAPPSPEAMANLPLMTRKSRVSNLIGRKLSKTADAAEIAQAYAVWYAKWYLDTHGSEYRAP